MSGETMNKEEYYLEIRPELEVVEVEQENDHQKLMKAYKKINQKIDNLIEKRKAKK